MDLGLRINEACVDGVLYWHGQYAYECTLADRILKDVC
ncbi:hypothetical protein SP21_91 [Salmonella phage 21]|nr:hypothetical protein SP21_91 [Salmonella phage 21]